MIRGARPTRPPIRAAAVLVLGLVILATELALRGERDLRTQIIGQCIAFGAFVPAAWLCWRGLDWGRAGVVAILLLALAFRVAAFEPNDRPPISPDLNRYAWDARVAAHGINPYRYGTTDPALEHLRDADVWPSMTFPGWKTPYPPGAQVGFLTARGVFGHGRRATTWLFLLAEAAAILIMLAVLMRIGAPTERIALFAWHPLAISEIAANGHVDALALLPLAGLVLAWTAGRLVTAGALAGVAASIKFGPALLVLALARRARWRFVAAAAGAIVLICLPFLSVGAGIRGSAVRLIRASDFGSLSPLLTPHLGKEHGQALLGVILVVVLAIVARRRPRTAAELSAAALTVLGTALVTTPFLQPWYALWLLPFLVVAAGPGWVWLSGTLPLLYVYGLTRPMPFWVPLTIYGPPALWAVLHLLPRLRTRWSSRARGAEAAA